MPTANRGRGFRGLGEPVWPGRTSEELVECGRHEALLNVAFASGPPWRLACPYDVTTLGPTTLDEARRDHQALTEGGVIASSPTYRGLDDVAEPFDVPSLPPTRRRYRSASWIFPGSAAPWQSSRSGTPSATRGRPISWSRRTKPRPTASVTAGAGGPAVVVRRCGHGVRDPSSAATREAQPSGAISPASRRQPPRSRRRAPRR